MMRAGRTYGFYRASPLFDGVDDRLVFPNIAAYNTFIGAGTTPDFTISGWFYVTGQTAGSLNQCVFTNDEGSVGNGFIVTWNSNGTFTFQIRSVVCTTTATFTLGGWYHFICKKIGATASNNIIKIDGVQRSFSVAGGPGNLNLSQNTSIYVGALPSATGPSGAYRQLFKGYIDDLMWINRLTTDKEDFKLYNSGRGGRPASILQSDLLFEGKFDEVSGNAIDTSPNANVGVFTNMAGTNRVMHHTLVP